MQIIEGLVRKLETKAPWGLRRAVEKDRKADEADRPFFSQSDRETFRFFELETDDPLGLDGVVQGREESNGYGTFWVSTRPIDSFWHPRPLLPEPNSRDLYFDIETRGGRGSAGFLFGAVWHNGQDWILHLILARNPSEEAAWLAAVADLINLHPHLISYSGLKNDWPFLMSRWKEYRLRPPEAASHLDLFDLAQALYRGVLPSCRLVTLERHLCARWREADLPSGFIPVAYSDWLETGDARLLAQVMCHNALDVACLLELRPLLEVQHSLLPLRLPTEDPSSVVTTPV